MRAHTPPRVAYSRRQIRDSSGFLVLAGRDVIGAVTPKDTHWQWAAHRADGYGPTATGTARTAKEAEAALKVAAGKEIA